MRLAPAQLLKGRCSLWLLSCIATMAACDVAAPMVAPAPPPADLAAHCRAQVGPPRIERVTASVAVARGFDLANTTVIQTADGLVVVDPGMTTARSEAVRAAFAKEGIAGRVAAVIFTHSHVDHVGGAKAWVDDQDPPPEIWATDAFIPHLFKQYGVFRVAEAQRGARQFGYVVDEETLPCISIGRRIDLDGALNTGMRLPTRSFTGEQVLTIGGVQLHLVEAHGETHDQLFVWLPARRLAPSRSGSTASIACAACSQDISFRLTPRRSLATLRSRSVSRPTGTASRSSTTTSCAAPTPGSRSRTSWPH